MNPPHGIYPRSEVIRQTYSKRKVTSAGRHPLRGSHIGTYPSDIACCGAVLELLREDSFAGVCLALHFGNFPRIKSVTLMLQSVIGSRGLCVTCDGVGSCERSDPIHLPAPRSGSLPGPSRDTDNVVLECARGFGLTDSTLFNYHQITRTIVLGNPYYRVNDLLIDLRQTFHDCFQLTFGKIVGALNF